MKIIWNIDYETLIAKCNQLEVQIIEANDINNLPLQTINNAEIGIGFQKVESGKLYWCKILKIEDALFKANLKENKLLPNYASQLGDVFVEKNNNS